MFTPLLVASTVLLVVGAVLALQNSFHRGSKLAYALNLRAMSRRIQALDSAAPASSKEGSATALAQATLLHEFALEQRAGVPLAVAVARHWRSLPAALAFAVATATLVGVLVPSIGGDDKVERPATVSASPANELATLENAYAKLRAFVENGPSPTLPTNMSTAASGPGGLPDVETAIGRLAARLATNPEDVEGWRMLGWSYYQTQRFALSADAYAKAVSLAPDDAALESAHAEAKAAAAKSAPPGPSSDDIVAARSLSAEDRQQMIVAMVERLASRLAGEPRDEDGWIRLARARIVLGDRAAARAALDTARKVFAADADALARIAAIAAQLEAETR